MISASLRVIDDPKQQVIMPESVEQLSRIRPRAITRTRLYSYSVRSAASRSLRDCVVFDNCKNVRISGFSKGSPRTHSLSKTESNCANVSTSTSFPSNADGFRAISSSDVGTYVDDPAMLPTANVMAAIKRPFNRFVTRWIIARLTISLMVTFR